MRSVIIPIRFTHDHVSIINFFLPFSTILLRMYAPYFSFPGWKTDIIVLFSILYVPMINNVYFSVNDEMYTDIINFFLINSILQAVLIYTSMNFKFKIRIYE